MVSIGCFCLGVILLPAVFATQGLQQQTCTRENSVTIQAGSSAYLGGIVTISEAGDEGYGCVPPYKFMQAIEAMRWVLDLLNKINETISTEYVTDYYVPGITLGMKLFDSCYRSAQAVASLADIYPELLAGDNQCTKQDEMTFGVVGPSNSDDSMATATAAQPYHIPLISFQSTNPALSANNQYPNFLRTIPPDDRLMQVIVEVLGYLEWKYIVIMYEDSGYGRAAYAEFHSRYVAAGHCLTAAIPFDVHNLEDSYVDSILSSALATEATGVLYFGHDGFAKALINRGEVRMPESGRLQWLMMNLALDETFPTTIYQRGIISVTVASRFIVEFEDHWVRLNPFDSHPENPWFREWYEMRNNCSITPAPGQRNCADVYGVTLTDKEREELLRADYVQDQTVEPAIMAIFTYANALRRAQMDKCTSSGPCDALRSMSREEFLEDYIKTVDFTFTSDERVPSLASYVYEPYLAAKRLSYDANGDIENPSFYIWNFNNIETGAGENVYKFRRVGTYINGNLDMNPNNIGMYSETRRERIQPFPKSLCPDTGCSPCIGLPTETVYYYEPGDIVINGLFSLHDMGPDPLSCGGLKNPNQVMFMEAMIYAIDSVNNDGSLLPGIKLGGLGIDDCSSSAVGQAFIGKLQQGLLKINKDGSDPLDPLSIKAYTGAHTSPLTIPLAELMNSFEKPLVGYRAGNSELDNREMYPYYVRAFPGIREEMWAIILLLKNFGWMHVQVVASEMHYSEDAERIFRDLAAKEGICIVAKHVIGTTSETADAAVRGMSVVTVAPTVALLDTHEQHLLLQALGRSPNTRSRIALIATSRWGTNEKLVEGMEHVADGVLTLSQRHSTLETFLNYLSNFRYNNHDKNPWFDDWFAQVHNCSQATCSSSVEINDGSGFEVLYEIENVINSVRAIAEALHSLLNRHCGVGFTGVCSEFITDSSQAFVDEIRSVQFPIEDMAAPNTFRFSGSFVEIGFDVYNFRSSNYELVATVQPWDNGFNQRGRIFLQGGQSPSSISTSCGEPCLECLYMFNYQDYLYVPGDLLIGVIFNIHYSGDGPYTCGDLRVKNGALYSEVVRYILDRINSGLGSASLRAPLKLGVLGFDGCSNPTRTLAILNRATTNLASIAPSVTESEIIAWITYDSETTQESALFLQKLDIPIVSPGATAPSLADTEVYKTLFRTAPVDAVIARGMADFVNNMGFSFVLVVNAPDTSSREAADLFTTYLKDYGICVVARYEFVTDGNVNIIRGSLDSFDTQVVAVFAEPEQYIDDFLVAGRAWSKDLRFIANRRWFPAVGILSDLEDSVFFEMSSPTVNDFYTYLRSRNVLSSDNPWLSAIYEEIFECNLPGSFSKDIGCALPQSIINSDDTDNIWTLPTIHAVTAITQALNSTLTEKCGSGYNSVCANFMHDEDVQRRFMQYMDDVFFRDVVNLVFEFINRQSNRGYLLYQYQFPGSPVQVGTLSPTGSQAWFNEPELRESFEDVTSECADECLACQTSDLSLKDYSYVNGRVYIIGLFDVHKKGPTPFSCGEINDDHGIQLLEAFNYALEYVNSGQGIFRDKLSAFTLGGFGLDTCQSPTRAANLVSNIHSGNLELIGGGRTITTRQIEAYIGTMETESSIRVADILSQLQIPQISYGATGMDLLDHERYDYFLRSVPADDKQARAVISYLKKFEYNNIQVINSFDEIGEPGAKEFERLADLNLVCITTKHTLGISDDIDAEADEIIGRITQKSNAEVVVLWMKDPLPVLLAAAKNNFARTQILFIGTDKWGAHLDILQRTDLRPLLAEENLVILDVETADFPEFDHYLESKTPGNYTRNPWFKEYYESHFSCVWDLPVRPGETACDRSASIPRALHYVQDPYVLYVINAVFSIALAIDKTLKEFCVDETGANFGVCNLYRTSGERRQRVLRQLRQVRFMDNTHQPFFYTEDGQSDRGFHIYNVTRDSSDPNSFMYQNIGSYNDSNFLKLDIRYDSEYSALCDPDGADHSLDQCTCPFDADLPSRFMKKDEGGRGLTLAYIGDIHMADPNNKFACGPINTGVDLQRLLAFFFAIDRINSNADFNLPDSIRLDGVALDSCSSNLRLGQDVYNLLSGNPLCDSDEAGTIVAPSSIVAFVVDKNHNALPVSSMLAQEDLITISPTASHGDLDDEFQHPYFLRTTGGNREQAQVILELTRDNQWDLLSVIYTDTAQHRAAVEDLLTRSRTQGICVNQASRLSLDATSQDVQAAMHSLMQQNGMKAIVLFVEPAHVRLIMETTRELRLTGQYIWIFPPTWDTHMADISGYEPELRGSILIQHRSGILDAFIDYMTQLTFTNRHGIPDDWFEEIYETIHQCNIFNRDIPSTRRYSLICSENEVITRDMVMEDLSVLHVILSVYSAALGVNNVPVCSGDIDIAACLQLQDQKNRLIYAGILGINFRVFPNELGNNTFDFTYGVDGNGQAGYNIKYYTTTDNGVFLAKDLGFYTAQGLSAINWAQYREDAFGIDSSSANRVNSRCPLTTICTCQGAAGASWEYLSSGATSRETCDREGEIINDPDTGELTTLKKPGRTDRFEDTWAIIVIVLAGLGALISLALFIYLLFMYPVRGGTSVLGYILSFGIILLYLMVLPFIAHADESMCALRKFGLGFVYALVYSALLVKLVDCWRVRGKNDSYSIKYSKLGRPFGLFFITVFLVLVQVMIDAEWLILEEPEIECVVYRNSLWPRCIPDDFYDEGLVLSLCYIMVLIVFSFILGLITYTSKQNHRESRWILAIFALSIPCWIIWCVVAIRAELKVRDAAVAVGLLVNATIILIFVPIRKLYLLRRYNALIEEEEKLAKEGDYNSTYGQQYDNTPRLHDTGSVRGSSVGPRTYTGSGAY